jgi:hypothetical protein
MVTIDNVRTALETAEHYVRAIHKVLSGLDPNLQIAGRAPGEDLSPTQPEANTLSCGLLETGTCVSLERFNVDERTTVTVGLLVKALKGLEQGLKNIRRALAEAKLS